MNIKELTDTELTTLQNEIAEELRKRRFELRKEAEKELNAFIRKWNEVGITFETRWYDLNVDEFIIHDCDDDEDDEEDDD